MEHIIKYSSQCVDTNKEWFQTVRGDAEKLLYKAKSS